MTWGVSPRLAIAGAGAITSHGVGWRGLGQAVRLRTLEPKTCTPLAAWHQSVVGSQVSEIPVGRTAEERRARMLMSRSAALASVACEAALADADWLATPADVGFYLGVGASGGSMQELEAMLARSVHAGELSLERFGDAGLCACNPLFAFQLMNNFTLCHAAILHGTGGPNSALFSRGAGTVLALSEAAYAINEGACTQALVGGADSALHPVTWNEMLREGYVDAGFVAGEGAALMALEAGDNANQRLAFLEHCTLGLSAAELPRAWSRVTAAPAEPAIDVVLIAPWGQQARDALIAFVSEALPGVPVIDTTACLGDALAATPALAWVVALDLLVAAEYQRALIISAGIDARVGLVVMARGESA